jgi:hypothetical protein
LSAFCRQAAEARANLAFLFSHPKDAAPGIDSSPPFPLGGWVGRLLLLERQSVAKPLAPDGHLRHSTSLACEMIKIRIKW